MGSDLDTEPLRLALGSMIALDTGERAVIQVLARPATSTARYRLLRAARHLKRAQPQALPFWATGAGARQVSGNRPAMDPTVDPDVRVILAKASSPLWHCAVRLAVTSPRRPHARGKIHALAGGFAVFEGRNGFRRRRIPGGRRIISLEKAIGQLEARQGRLVRSLELDDDADGVTFGVTFRRIRERMDELENERLRKLDELHALRGQEPDADPATPDLLEELPVGDVRLSSAPEHLLRRMFESFRLQVRYDKVASWATCRVAIKEDALDQLLTDSSALLTAQANDPDGGVPFGLVPPAGTERKGRSLDRSVQIAATYFLMPK